MNHDGPDHPIFKRFSRSQMLVRRLNVGFQAIFYEIVDKATECVQCSRQFNTTWKSYLCHICGMQVCTNCSNAIERERIESRIQFIRACMSCQGMLNKWSDPDILMEYATSPWVVTSSNSQLSLNLSAALSQKKHQRHAVVTFLRLMGMKIESISARMHLMDHIKEDDWIGASASVTENSNREEAVGFAKHLVQLCFDIFIQERTLGECVFAEQDGVRTYPLYFDQDTGLVKPPSIPNEKQRFINIAKYDLIEKDLHTPEIELICELAAKELDAKIAFISVLVKEVQHTVATFGKLMETEREPSQSFCSFALATDSPFLVRDASLDIRFRNFEVVREENIRFYVSFPIRSSDGSVIASLCVVDETPRKHITTMQYSVMKILADAISLYWRQTLLKEDN
jgi:hypothetical protein